MRYATTIIPAKALGIILLIAASTTVPLLVESFLLDHHQPNTNHRRHHGYSYGYFSQQRVATGTQNGTPIQHVQHAGARSNPSSTARHVLLSNFLVTWKFPKTKEDDDDDGNGGSGEKKKGSGVPSGDYMSALEQSSQEPATWDQDTTTMLQEQDKEVPAPFPPPQAFDATPFESVDANGRVQAPTDPPQREQLLQQEQEQQHQAQEMELQHQQLELQRQKHLQQQQLELQRQQQREQQQLERERQELLQRQLEQHQPQVPLGQSEADAGSANSDSNGSNQAWPQPDQPTTPPQPPGRREVPNILANTPNANGNQIGEIRRQAPRYPVRTPRQNPYHTKKPTRDDMFHTQTIPFGYNARPPMGNQPPNQGNATPNPARGGTDMQVQGAVPPVAPEPDVAVPPQQQQPMVDESAVSPAASQHELTYDNIDDPTESSEAKVLESTGFSFDSVAGDQGDEGEEHDAGDGMPFFMQPAAQEAFHRSYPSYREDADGEPDAASTTSKAAASHITPSPPPFEYDTSDDEDANEESETAKASDTHTSSETTPVATTPGTPSATTPAVTSGTDEELPPGAVRSNDNPEEIEVPTPTSGLYEDVSALKHTVSALTKVVSALSTDLSLVVVQTQEVAAAAQTPPPPPPPSKLEENFGKVLENQLEITKQLGLSVAELRGIQEQQGEFIQIMAQNDMEMTTMLTTLRDDVGELKSSMLDSKQYQLSLAQRLETLEGLVRMNSQRIIQTDGNTRQLAIAINATATKTNSIEAKQQLLASLATAAAAAAAAAKVPVAPSNASATAATTTTNTTNTTKMVETTETTASSEAKEAPSKPAAPKRAATPQALELIKKNKLDIDEIEGSGNFGRIVVDDVNDFLKTKETVGEEDDKNDKLAAAVDAAATKSVGNEEKEDEETSGLELDSIEILMPSFTQVPLQDKFVRFTEKQQDMASKSEASLQIPTFRVSREIKMDRFHALFQSLKSEGVSVTSLLAKAVALSVQEHPVINSSFDEGGGLMYKGDINVAMAVATPDGVITPTIKNTNLKSVQEISTMWKDLVRKARAGTLRPEEHQNRTITITNLSMYDVTNFDALLEEGQGTVVAIGAMQEKFVESEDSMLGYAASKTMIVTVACDHRQIYGADAALFLTSLASIMEKRLDALLE